MKYFITFILLIIIFAYGQIMRAEFPLVLNITLVVFIFLTFFLWEYSVINKNYDADFKIRSQNKKIGIFEFVSAVAWTGILLTWNFNSEELILFAFMFWSFPLTELIMLFVYKAKKPFTLFIKENELILNKRWNQKRNLTELTQIRFERYSKNLKLDFKSKPEISIKTTEYKAEDIQIFLGILIDKSEYNVFVPQNFELKKNSC